jgi:hypothetical protein
MLRFLANTHIPRKQLALAAAAVLLVGALFPFSPPTAAAIECPTLTLPRPTEPYEVTRARLEELGEWHVAGNPVLTPPRDPQLGDTWMWYVWNLGGFPVATLKPATVRGVGDHCYVVVDDDEWNVTMDQEDVDRILLYFDNQSVGDFPDQGIWDLDTSHFGDPPNPLDNLDRIFLFYYRFNISADGYFWVYDQYPDGTQPFASNECDVVYLATDSGQPASNYMLAVAAHEFQHMIHFARDANEDTWVDEGLGELAMWLFGNPDIISGFNSNPDNSLLVWNAGWADYIKTYLWTLYMYEQYGGQPLIWDLIHNLANGMTGYQLALFDQGFLDVDTRNVFADWGAANFLDDTTIDAGQYGYIGDVLPPFTAFRTHASYPVVSASGSVQPHATDYVRLQNFASSVLVSFDGYDLREFRVTLLAIDAELPTLVEPLPLNEQNAGSLDFLAAAGYDEVIIAIANVSLSGSGSYTYGVIESTLSDAPPAFVVASELRSYPNPFNPRTEFQFELAKSGTVQLTVHDLRGREVARLLEGPLPAGAHRIPWTPNELAAGVYVGRLAIDGQEITQRKVTVIK